MAISSKCNSCKVHEFVEWTGFEGTDRYIEYLKEKTNEALGLPRNFLDFK